MIHLQKFERIFGRSSNKFVFKFSTCKWKKKKKRYAAILLSRRVVYSIQDVKIYLFEWVKHVTILGRSFFICLLGDRSLTGRRIGIPSKNTF